LFLPWVCRVSIEWVPARYSALARPQPGRTQADYGGFDVNCSNKLIERAGVIASPGNRKCGGIASLNFRAKY